MGIGFVILIHLFIIAFLSSIGAVLCGLLTYFISGKERRRQKVILAVIAPFVGFYTFYIVGITGLSIVSEHKNVDVGFGDAWYVPLQHNYQLLFIDIPEQAGINNKTGETLVSRVTKIEEYGNQIFGKNFDNKYFLIDTKTDVVKTFDTESDLTALHPVKRLNLTDATQFYSERKDSIMGYWSFLIGFLSLIISIGAVYIWKLILIF